MQKVTMTDNNILKNALDYVEQYVNICIDIVVTIQIQGRDNKREVKNGKWKICTSTD